VSSCESEECSVTAATPERLRQLLEWLDGCKLPSQYERISQADEHVTQNIHTLAGWLGRIGSEVDLIATAKGIDPLLDFGLKHDATGRWIREPVMSVATADSLWCECTSIFVTELSRLVPDCLRCSAA